MCDLLLSPNDTFFLHLTLSLQENDTYQVDVSSNNAFNGVVEREGGDVQIIGNEQ